MGVNGARANRKDTTGWAPFGLCLPAVADVSTDSPMGCAELSMARQVRAFLLMFHVEHWAMAEAGATLAKGRASARRPYHANARRIGRPMF